MPGAHWNRVAEACRRYRLQEHGKDKCSAELISGADSGEPLSKNLEHVDMFQATGHRAQSSPVAGTLTNNGVVYGTMWSLFN